MTAQRLVVALTGLNLALVASGFFSRTRPAVAASGVAPVLRGRALEIVDDRGRVRASIAVLPADPAFKMPDGTTGYPETVLLRLRSEEHTSELQSPCNLVCRLLLEKKKKKMHVVSVRTRSRPSM